MDSFFRKHREEVFTMETKDIVSIYTTEVTYRGSFSGKFLAEGIMLIFPDSSEVQEIKEYSFLTRKADLHGEIAVGDQVKINDHSYTISHLGEIAEKNLAELGHITIKFGSPVSSVMPGTIYLENQVIPHIDKGSVLSILKASSK